MATLTRAWREKKKSSLIPVVLLYTVQGGTWFSAVSFLLALLHASAHKSFTGQGGVELFSNSVLRYTILLLLSELHGPGN
jgi:hypothetical protein